MKDKIITKIMNKQTVYFNKLKLSLKSRVILKEPNINYIKTFGLAYSRLRHNLWVWCVTFINYNGPKSFLLLFYSFDKIYIIDIKCIDDYKVI